jgi:hypothetical protein
LSRNISSDSFNGDPATIAIIDELLDLLDKARNLDDLVISLKAQSLIIKVLLLLLG